MLSIYMLFDISLSNIFLGMFPQAKKTKGKINKWDYIKLKSFCTAKKTVSKIKSLWNVRRYFQMIYPIRWFFCLFFTFCTFRAILMACGGSQAKGQIGATAASLYHSHSNAGSEPHLQPTPQLTAALDS